jgi:hypothetical protein
MTVVTDSARADELLNALGEQLEQEGASIDLVVVGGSALLALGLVQRATRDVDVVALLSDGDLMRPEPLPDPLIRARDRVTRDFGLPDDWLNAAPRSLLDLGMPAGFVDRLETRPYGDFLTVHYASRLDQIHFKLFALVDQGPGKHEADLRQLRPTSEELVQAARWTRTHDPSDAFRGELEAALVYLGVDDADLDA